MGSKDGRNYLLTADDMFFAYSLMRILTNFSLFFWCVVSIYGVFLLIFTDIWLLLLFFLFLSFCPVYLLLYQFIICMCTKFINYLSCLFPDFLHIFNYYNDAHPTSLALELF